MKINYNVFENRNSYESKIKEFRKFENSKE